MISDLPAFLGGDMAFPSGPSLPVHDPAIFRALQSSWNDASWASYDSGHVLALEKLIGEHFLSPHVLTCSSGTLGVETSLKALGIKPGDLVGMAAYEYPGNFLAIHALGAKPFLIDLDPANWQISPLAIDVAIEVGCKAVIVSHLHGGHADMKTIMAKCKIAGVGVIEDACQNPGAVVQGKNAGTWGDFGVLSFGGSKLITAGRGGAILSNKPEFAQKAKMLLLRGSKLAPLSEIQAVVLLPQLENLNKTNAFRMASVNLLQTKLHSINGIELIQASFNSDQHAFYKLGLRLNPQEFGLDRECLVPAMQAEGIALDAGFAALHVSRSPSRWQSAGPLPEAANAHENMLVLHHPVLLQNESAMNSIAHAFEKVQSHAEKVRKKFYS
jgi:dTDP-4-amino-4,6-dideoxygalactose transaminase